MNEPMWALEARSVEPPPHVPPDCVFDVDLYRMPGSERDFLAPWKALQQAARRPLVWTPRNGGHWIALRPSDVARIYADHVNFSSRLTIVPREWGERFPLRPTTLDPPAHLLYRRVLTAVLTRTTTERAEPHIRMLAARAAERLRLRGECELMADFAAGIPLALFAHLANIPRSLTESLPAYADDPRAADLSATPPMMDRFARFLRGIIAERRAHPGEDLLSRIATSTVEDRPIDEDEAVELATAVLTGSLDTVVSTWGLMILHLARTEALRRRLAADPSAIPGAIAAMLRRFPIMTKARVVRHDQDLEGVRMRAGDMVVLPPLSDADDAHGDEAGCPVARRAPHSTFGNGVHRCPGASLAQRELEIMLEEWLARVPEFAVDPRQAPRMRGGVLGTVLALHLRWDPSSTRSVTPA